MVSLSNHEPPVAFDELRVSGTRVQNLVDP